MESSVTICRESGSEMTVSGSFHVLVEVSNTCRTAPRCPSCGTCGATFRKFSWMRTGACLQFPLCPWIAHEDLGVYRLRTLGIFAEKVTSRGRLISGGGRNGRLA
jgi:hypothetical protein